MPTVRDILSHKGSDVHSIPASATVLEATRVMNEHKIGALVVVQDGAVVGIFTERDVLTRVISANRSPAELLVAEVMTNDVVCVGPDEDIHDVSRIMKDRRIRHIPVCTTAEDTDLMGIVSMGDLNALNASDQQRQIHFLNEYIFGRA